MTHIILTSWIGGDEKINGDLIGSAAMYLQIVGIWRNMILTYDLTYDWTYIYIYLATQQWGSNRILQTI